MHFLTVFLCFLAADNWDVHTATASSTRRFGTLDPVLAYLEFNVVEVARILNDTTRINVDCDFMTNKHVVPFRPRAVGQMRSLAKVWALLLEFERKQGIVFDFVIRLRPDTAFLHSLPAWPTWVEAVNENRAAGLGGPGPGLGMHTWVPGLKLWPHVTSFRERGGSVPLFLPPENCFVRWHAHNPRLLLPCGFFQILTCIAHFHNIPLSQLDVPADHFAIHTRAAAETTFSMADLYDRCKGADLLAPDSTHWCCGGGITSLNMWSILQQHPNGALICAQHYILQETHTFSFLTATLTEFPFPVLLVRPRWVTYDSCTARNDPIQRYGGDWLPRCAMSNMPGCGEEDQDELAAAVASAGAWAPARRVRN